jgi:hypothetical protein
MIKEALLQTNLSKIKRLNRQGAKDAKVIMLLKSRFGFPLRP